MKIIGDASLFENKQENIFFYNFGGEQIDCLRTKLTWCGLSIVTSRGENLKRGGFDSSAVPTIDIFDLTSFAVCGSASR